MPTWLAVVLGVWSVLATLLSVVLVPLFRWLLRSMRALIAKVERIDEHMDANSQLSQTVGGTLPARVTHALELLDQLDRRLTRLEHDE